MINTPNIMKPKHNKQINVLFIVKHWYDYIFMRWVTWTYFPFVVSYIYKQNKLGEYNKDVIYLNEIIVNDNIELLVSKNTDYLINLKTMFENKRGFMRKDLSLIETNKIGWCEKYIKFLINIK